MLSHRTVQAQDQTRDPGAVRWPHYPQQLAVTTGPVLEHLVKWLLQGAINQQAKSLLI